MPRVPSLMFILVLILSAVPVRAPASYPALEQVMNPSNHYLACVQSVHPIPAPCFEVAEAGKDVPA